MKEDENKVTIGGVTYHAVPKDEKVNGGIRHRSCSECAMLSLRKFSNVQNACSLVKCIPSERSDGRKVIFV